MSNEADQAARQSWLASAEAAASLRSLIDDRAIHPVYQPLVDLTAGELLGCEGLTRPATDYGFAHVGELFDAAGAHGMLWDLEVVTRGACLAQAGESISGGMLFMNCTPLVVTDARFLEAIAGQVGECGSLSPGRIVLEITERAEIADQGLLENRVLELREAGFRVAIDDVGAGTSGLNRIMTIKPDWLKLDRELIDHIDIEPFKQNLIEFFVRFARFSGVELIAEGIERAEELETLIELGVGVGQGFLLGRPAERAPDLDSDLGEWLRECSASMQRALRQHPHAITVADVMSPALSRGAHEQADIVSQEIDHPRIEGVAVVDGKQIVGWRWRREIDELASTDPTALIGCGVRPNALVMDPHTPLIDAIRAVSTRSSGVLMEPIIVAAGGDVIGALTPREMLRASVRVASGSAAHGVPITGLAGRVDCDQRLSSLLKGDGQIDAAFIDIVDFHLFNNRFGFEMGDMLLRILAGLIASLVGGDEDSLDHVAAHLGDDKFLVVRTGENMKLSLQKLVDEFEQSSARFLGVAMRGAQPSGGAVQRDGDSAPAWGLRIALAPDIGTAASSAHDVHGIGWQLRWAEGEPIGLRSQMSVNQRSEFRDQVRRRRRSA